MGGRRGRDANSIPIPIQFLVIDILRLRITNSRSSGWCGTAGLCVRVYARVLVLPNLYIFTDIHTNSRHGLAQVEGRSKTKCAIFLDHPTLLPHVSFKIYFRPSSHQRRSERSRSRRFCAARASRRRHGRHYLDSVRVPGLVRRHVRDYGAVQVLHLPHALVAVYDQRHVLHAPADRDDRGAHSAVHGAGPVSLRLQLRQRAGRRALDARELDVVLDV